MESDDAAKRHVIAVELTRDTPAWSPKELEKLEERLEEMKWIN